MAKKEDNFDFDTESKPKFSLDLNFKFLAKFTESQKKLLLVSAIIVAVVIVISVICLIIAASGGFNGNVNGGYNSSDDVNSGTGDNEEENGETSEIVMFYVSKTPDKTVYYVGDSPNYDGLSVYVRRANDESEYVHFATNPSLFKITGFDSSAPVNEQVITVEYEGHTDTFKVNILETPTAKPTLVSIRLDPAPRDTARAGVALSVKDSRIICVYSDGSEKSVKLAHSYLYGYENELMNAEVGDVITVYVRYTEDGYIAETSYTVTVIE